MQASEIRNGAIWSRHSFGRVTGAPAYTGDYVLVKNEHGEQWNVGHDIFNNEFVVADHFDETKKVARTTVVEVVLQHPYVAMTICFRKKADSKEVAKQIMAYAATAGKQLTMTPIKKIIDTAGEERVMLGRHQGLMNEHGRLMFFDMEANQMKQVDPRTVLWAIVKGTKYIVK